MKSVIAFVRQWLILFFIFTRHTLPIIRNADQILVVQNGKITECGTHDELVDKGGKYAKMWEAKAFALYDYYMEGKSKRYSRHLYDIYKLQNIVKLDDELINLVSEVRDHRAKMIIGMFFFYH